MRPLRAALIVYVTLLLLSLPQRSTPSAFGQQAWSWPERGKNLKVLPKDTSGQKLRAVMTGFTRALGVRCTHCHVGKEGEPLDTYDFASDDNPKKNVARGMYKMLGSVNDQLREIQPSVEDRVNMWCHTCHRGLSRPRTLAEELALVYDKSGADSTTARYRQLRAKYDNAGAYDFRETGLGEVGHHALEKKDVPGALTIFTANAELFPESPRVHENLGHAYLTAGDSAQAIASFEASLRLNPKNEAAAKALEGLRRPGGGSHMKR